VDENTRKVLKALIDLTRNNAAGVGFNEWKREVVSGYNRKNICALRTFQKIRDELIKNKIVTKTPHPTHKKAHLYSP
jgi:hypothetical protein